MFSVITAEIRWFFEGEVPENITGWFDEAGKHIISEPERIDTYLILPETINVGIKVRQGRVEVKKLIRNLGNRKLSDTISGHAEIWQKWSFDSDPSGKFPETFKPEYSQWIGILKKRKLHRYAIEAGQYLPLPSASDFPENGAHIELARVKVENNSWWTLGLEAFGNEKRLEKNLDLILSETFQKIPPVLLSLESSSGYPAWLAKLI